MARYTSVDSVLYRMPPMAFSNVPATAMAQTSPNSVQPQAPRSTPSVNGV